jgi:hypothetical protein
MRRSFITEGGCMAKAKKAKTAKRAKRAGGTTKKSSSRSKSADLKPIGAAFDRTIKSLQAIKKQATAPQEVAAKIAKLNRLKAQTRLECPQNWFVPYEVK